jgi:dienelactone hydrolase
MWGHPRKFMRLFSRWLEAGYVAAAPAFPHTNDENPPPYLIEDVVNQPADVSFVLDELLARGLGDACAGIGVGGYSLGAETALAVGLHPRFADSRVRAVVALVGALFHPEFAADALRPLPLLIVHGTEDRERRVRESLKVYEAAQEPKQLVTIEGAGHGLCQDDDPPAYVARVAELTTDFWDRYLRW